MRTNYRQNDGACSSLSFLRTMSSIWLCKIAMGPIWFYLCEKQYGGVWGNGKSKYKKNSYAPFWSLLASSTDEWCWKTFYDLGSWYVDCYGVPDRGWGCFVIFHIGRIQWRGYAEGVILRSWWAEIYTILHCHCVYPQSQPKCNITDTNWPFAENICWLCVRSGRGRHQETTLVSLVRHGYLPGQKRNNKEEWIKAESMGIRKGTFGQFVKWI